MIKYVIHDNLESLILFEKNNNFDMTLDLLSLFNKNTFDKKWVYNKLLFTQRNKFTNKILHIAPILGDSDVKKFIDNNIKLFKEIVISDYFGEYIDKEKDEVIKFPLYLKWFKNYTNEVFVYNYENNKLEYYK